MIEQVSMGFEPDGLLVPVGSILPLKHLSRTVITTRKYKQVLASVREVGIIEPLIVFQQKGEPESYLLLDGHLRLEALKQLGATHARCLVSTDDEAYTYNKRLNRVTPIQEHTMILKAIQRGVSEQRIAKVLDVNVGQIREKRDLLKGICREAADILKNRYVSPRAFLYMRRVKPMRQVEIAELMCAANNFGVPYAKALVASTHRDMLAHPRKLDMSKGLSAVEVSKIKQEMEVLQRDLKSVEETYGDEMLNLAVARGYLTRLLGDAKVFQYLSQAHPDLLSELRKVSEEATLESKLALSEA